MGFETVPLEGPFGAEVRGVDLSRPLDAETFEAVRHAFHLHGVLLFRDQSLTPAQHVAFSQGFGALEEHVQTQFLLDGHRDVFIVSNVDVDGKPLGARNCALSWHSDHSYHAVPSLGSLFYGVVVPEVGGDTWFAEMYRPYEELPATTKARLEGLSAVHDYRRLVQRFVRLATANTAGATGLCLDLHDLVLSKFVAGREKDMEFNRALAQRGHVSKRRLLRRAKDLPVNAEMLIIIRARIKSAYAPKEIR
jgi:hypothetical protein